ALTAQGGAERRALPAQPRLVEFAATRIGDRRISGTAIRPAVVAIAGAGIATERIVVDLLLAQAGVPFQLQRCTASACRHRTVDTAGVRPGRNGQSQHTGGTE